MVAAKRHKDNKNIENNTPLKMLVFQQEVQMFHWCFLHYKLHTVKYKVVLKICTMETPHMAGIRLTLVGKGSGANRGKSEGVV